MCLSTKGGVFNLAKGHKSMAPYSSYTTYFNSEGKGSEHRGRGQ